jgi:ribosome biogenesis GTPase
VLEVLERKNELIRPQVSNVDLGVVVTSCVKPNFSYNLLDRFLVTLESKNIQPLIYVTKMDIAPDDVIHEMKKMRAYYESIGYPVLFSDTPDKDVLMTYFKDKLTVFMGQSGAGKSTLLNKIAPDLNLEVADISEALGRGRHTTRHVELIELHGGLVADTPGFSSIDFLEIELQELPKQFPEFLEASEFCKFRECQHQKEPKCEVKKRVDSEEILLSRYENYLQFYEEVRTRKPKYNKK